MGLPTTNFFSLANPGFITTTSGSILSGAATIPLNTVSGLTNASIFVGIIEPGGTKQQVFTGVVDTSGLQLTSVVWIEGSNVDHSAGVSIVDYVSDAHHNMTTTGILKEHSQDGSHIAGNDGWIGANETWTYASATTITVPSNATTKYSKGDRIKLTQTTVKYFTVIGVTSTVLTITGGTDYTLTNAAITLNYYSHQTSPVGFPQYFNYLPTSSKITLGNGSNAGAFTIIGQTCFGYFRYIFGSTTSMTGTDPFMTTPVPQTTSLLNQYTAQMGSLTIIQSSSGDRYYGVCGFGDANNFDLLLQGTAATYIKYGFIASTVPITFTTNDTLHGNFQFRVA